MPQQNSIVENWITENESKLKQISVENKPLYESVFLALEYLNNTLGGNVITPPKIEPKIEPEIATEIPSYTKLTIGDKVKIPKTRFGSEILGGVFSLIDIATAINQSYLYVTDIEEYDGIIWLSLDMSGTDELSFSEIDNLELYESPKKVYLKSYFETLEGGSVGEILNEPDNINYIISWERPISYMFDGTYAKDLFTEVPPKFKVGDKVIFPKTQFNLRLSDGVKVLIKNTEIKGLDFLPIVDMDFNFGMDNVWTYWLAGESSFKYGFYEDDLQLASENKPAPKTKKPQKKSISLPIEQEQLKQEAEFEDLADELNNLEI